MFAPLDDGIQTVRQLVLVDHPVAQGAHVVVPLAEPAIVQYKGIDAQSLAAVDDTEQLLLVEVEIGGLPVIDDDGTHLVADAGMAQMMPEGVVEILGHTG